MKQIGISIAAILTLFLMTAGCMSWEEGWKEEVKASKKGDVEAILKKATEQMKQADTKEKVQELIKTYESVLQIDPANYEALSNLGSMTFLIGYGYTDAIEEKEDYYMKAAKYCERAMYTNSEFKKLIAQGKKTWEACESLSKKEMLAMYFWYMSVGNCWLECKKGFSKLINMYWPGRSRELLKAMMKIDPDWYGGAAVFSWATYYAVVPGFLGGDMEKSKEYFDRAIKAGETKINTRVVRARYFHAKNKDRKEFKKDLEWAVSQEPKKSIDIYPWGVFHKAKAKKMLKNIDQYF